MTLPERLTIIALCLAALAVGIFAATAKAAPFTPELETDFAYAAEWWGATPTGCSSLTREVVPTLPGEVNGEATRPVAGAAPVPCIIVIREGMPSCERREVVLHEYGHLLGYGHSEDPADVMYPKPTGAICRGVLAATFAAELRHEMRRCRHLRPGRHRRECWRRVREERRAFAGFLEEVGPTLLRRP